MYFLFYFIYFFHLCFYFKILFLLLHLAQLHNFTILWCASVKGSSVHERDASFSCFLKMLKRCSGGIRQVTPLVVALFEHPRFAPRRHLGLKGANQWKALKERPARGDVLPLLCHQEMRPGLKEKNVDHSRSTTTCVIKDMKLKPWSNQLRYFITNPNIQFIQQFQEYSMCSEVRDIK